MITYVIKIPINNILIPDSIALVDNQYLIEDRNKYPGQLALTGRLLMHESYVAGSENSLQHFDSGGSPFVKEAGRHLFNLREDFVKHLLRQKYNTSTMENTVFVPIDISQGAPGGLEQLFKDPHYLKHIFDVGFPSDDISKPTFRISPSNITELHPIRSGRAMGTGFYEFARDKSNTILVAYAQTLNPNISIPKNI